MRIIKILIPVLGCLFCLSACATETNKNPKGRTEKIKKELCAAADCYQTIYASAGKGKGMNPVLEKGEIHKIVQQLADILPRVWKMTAICRMDGQWRKIC